MLDPDVATKALQTWCQKRGAEQGVEDFMQLLKDKDSLYLVPLVKRRLKEKVKHKNREQTLHVNTAQSLSDAQKNQLTDLLGDNYSFHASLDESLLAGLQASYQNRKVRGSLNGRLTNLHTHLTT